MKSKLYFVSAVLTGALCFIATAQAQPVKGFESICTLDESCSVERPTLVAFAMKELKTYKTLSGNFICNPSTFDLPEDFGSASSDAQCYAMLAAVGSSSGASSSGADPEEVPKQMSAGTFAIVSLSSGRALALGKPDAKDDKRVVQQDFQQLAHQVWQLTPLDSGYYSITVPGTDLALESKDWDTRDGAKLHKTSWINSWNQHWLIEDTGKGALAIRSRLSSQVMDAYPMTNKNSGDVVLWTYWGGENQHWRLVPIDLPAATQSKP